MLNQTRMSRTINCTLESGIVVWAIIFFENMDPIPVYPDNSPLPGVTAVGQSGLSMLTLNTSNTSTYYISYMCHYITSLSYYNFT